jgi:uncharacterized protein (TIGR03067 family)
MKNILLKISFIALLLPLLSATDTKTQHVGTWKGEDPEKISSVHLMENGNAFFINKKDTIGGESFKIHEGMAEMVYEVDYNTAPKRLDFIIRMKKSKTEISRMKSIFKFDQKGKMNLCMNFTGEDRPEEFYKERTLVLVKK